MKVVFSFFCLSIFSIIHNGETASDQCKITPTDQYGNSKTRFGYGTDKFNTDPCCDDTTVWCKIEAKCPYTAQFFVQNKDQFRQYQWVNWQPLLYGNAEGDPSTEAVTCQHGEDECQFNQILASSCSLYSSPRNMQILACHFEYVMNDTESNDTIKKCINDNGGNADDVYKRANSAQGTDDYATAANYTNQMINGTGTPSFRVNDIRTPDDQMNNAIRQDFKTAFCDMQKSAHCQDQCQQPQYGVNASIS